MGLEVKVLDLGDIELDTSFLVLALEPGGAVQCRRSASSSPAARRRCGRHRLQRPVDHGQPRDEGLVAGRAGHGAQLAKHGLSREDVRYVLHTHLHIDHAGYDDQFPMDGTTVVINRRELEYSVSGLMGEQYPAPYIKHLVDRLHHPGALRLLDLEVVDYEEIIPGVRCQAAGGHTEGSMNILVDTDEGVACICGDVIYDIAQPARRPAPAAHGARPGGDRQPRRHQARREGGDPQGGRLGRFVLPAHDRPASSRPGASSGGRSTRAGGGDPQRGVPRQADLRVESGRGGSMRATR